MVHVEPIVVIPMVYEGVERFFKVSRTFPQVEVGKRPPKELIELCIKLINEEVNDETIPELGKLLEKGYSYERMAKILDGIVDSIYVLLWTAVAFDLPFNKAWMAVQDANMAKFPIHKDCGGSGCGVKWEHSHVVSNLPCITQCIEGRLVTKNKETGKVMKPEGWVEPDIWKILFETWSLKAARANGEYTSGLKENS